MALALRSRLLDHAGFDHGFTTRAAGNFARGAEPVPAGVRVLHQVHSAIVRVVGAETPADLVEVEGDGLVTSTGAVGVRVADCVPLLLADPLTRTVAAVHAGWRGVEGGIVAEALRAFGEGSASRVLVALGPSIGRSCFEVGRDVAERIAASSDDACWSESAADAAAGKRHVDLRAALETQLVRLGIDAERTERVGGCTFCSAEGFHSYRRDGAASGRLLGWITG